MLNARPGANSVYPLYLVPVSLLFFALIGCGGSTAPQDVVQEVGEPPPAQTLVARVSQDMEVEAGVSTGLTGEVLLDGLNTELADIAWQQLSGAGSAVFSAPSSLQTEVFFDREGVYVLRMTAAFAGLSSADTLRVTVSAAVINEAPQLDAGEDIEIESGELLELGAVVTDDGLPQASLSTQWSQLSGQGVATFSEISQLDTTVSFSHSGSYTLQLQADDGELVSHDTLQVTVLAVQSEPLPADQFANASADWQRVFSSDGSKPQARHEAGGVMLDEQFYLLGGRGRRQVNRYDPLSNRWENLGTPALQLNHFQPVVWNRKIYVIGALDCCYPSERVVDRIQIFDPHTRKWSQGATMPANRKRGSAGTVVYNNKIYLIGGTTNGHDGGMVNWFDEYDPTSNSWKTLPNAPTRRDHFQAVVVGHRLVAAGGRQSDYPDTFGNLVSRVDVYNFETGKWESGAPNIPVPRAGTVAVAYGPEAIIVGGEKATAGAASRRVDAYNVNTRRWRRLDDLNETRHGGGAALLGHELHVASGSNNRGGAPETQSHEKLVLTPR